MIEAKVVSEKTVENKPAVIHESVRKKTCFACGNPTLTLRLLESGDEAVGTVNICVRCDVEIRAEAAKNKFGGTSGALKEAASKAGESAKVGAKKLWSFAKDLLK